MKNFSIKSKLFMSFAGILLFINILGFYSLYSMSVINLRLDDVAVACMGGILDAQEMNVLATNARNKEVNISAQTEATRIQREQSTRLADIAAMGKLIENYENTIAAAFYDSEVESQEDQRMLNSLKGTWTDYLAASDMSIAYKLSGNSEQAQNLVDNNSLEKYEFLLNSIGAISRFNIEAADESAIIAKNAYRQSTILSIAIQIISLLLTLAAGYIIYISIKKPIDELSRVSMALGQGDLQQKVKIYSNDEFGQLSQEYNKTIEQMKILIVQLQDTAQQLAASSQQLTASAELSSCTTINITENAVNISEKADSQIKNIDNMKIVVSEMSDEIDETAQITGESAEHAKAAAQTITDGLELIEQASGQMAQIESSVDKTVKVVEMLGDHSKEIGCIVETISAISAQTNLLALNAAIEAARAGEHGLGFSVVADEVRKLAEQSQESTEKIAHLIKLIQKHTEEMTEAMNTSACEVELGGKAVAQSGLAFNRLAQMAGNIGTQVGEIAGKMTSVLGKTTNIMNVVQDVQISGETTQKDSRQAACSLEEQSATIQEIAASSQALAALAESMQGITQKFKV